MMVSAHGIGAAVLLVLAVLLVPAMATPSIPLPFTSGVVPTGSMVPAINVGDLILVDRTVGFSDVAAGDVVMFRGNDLWPISHRVLAHDGFEITTKGDANQFKDAPITEDAYLGVVSAVVPTHMLGPAGYAIGMMLTVSLLLVMVAFLLCMHGYRQRIR